ncbi:hypothetical protein LTR17_025542, partial [Elasticomyces elasticus]
MSPGSPTEGRRTRSGKTPAPKPTFPNLPAREDATERQSADAQRQRVDTDSRKPPNSPGTFGRLGEDHLRRGTGALPPWAYNGAEAVTSAAPLIRVVQLDEAVMPRPSPRVFACLNCVKKYRPQGKNNPNPFAVTDICGATPTDPRCGRCKVSTSNPKYLRVFTCRASDPASAQRRTDRFREYCASFVK